MPLMSILYKCEIRKYEISAALYSLVVVGFSYFMTETPGGFRSLLLLVSMVRDDAYHIHREVHCFA